MILTALNNTKQRQIVFYPEENQTTNNRKVLLADGDGLFKIFKICFCLLMVLIDAFGVIMN